MPVKSVIDIDLDDSKFARFKELFDRYSETLAKTPAMWKAASKEQAGMMSAFERQTAAILAQVQVQREGDEADKERVKRLTTSERLWTSISHSSSTIAKNVLDIGAGVLKWGAIIGGGLLGGALFGLDRLGSSTSSERRSSMGLGLSIGQQQAFGTNFGRFVNPDSFLSGINSAVSNIANQGPLYALGVNPNQSTEQVALATLRAARAKALSTPVNQLGILESAYGLDKLGISTEDLRRLRSTSSSEFNSQMLHYGQDVRSFGIDDPTARKWQDFTTQVGRAGEQIFKTFVIGLAPLAQPLEHLSAGFAKFLATLLKSPLIARGIDDLSHWLENFSGQISAPKFLQSVEGFVSDVGALARALHDAIDWIGGVPNIKKEPGAAVLGGVQGATNARWRENFLADPKKSDYLKLLAETEDQFKLPRGTLINQWQRESGSTLNPPNSPKGAMGPMGFMPDTSDELGINPHNPLQAAWGAGQYDANLLKHYHGDIQKTLAAYNYGQGNVDKAIRAHPTDWLLYTPKETQNYVTDAMSGKGTGLRIEINNNTGGSAVVAASQLSP